MDRPTKVLASRPDIVLPIGDLPVPVTLGVLIQGRKHDRENDVDIVADQIAEVLVIPEIKSSLGNLEMGASDRFGQLMEERLLNFGKFGRVHDFKDVLHLIEEHDFFGAVDLGPIPQEAEHNLQIALATSQPKVKESHTSSVKDASFSRNCTMQYAS